MTSEASAGFVDSPAPVNSPAPVSTPGLDPVASVGEGDGAIPTIRNPITFSATPVGYRLPPPGLDEHGGELRAWLGSSIDNEEIR